MVEIAALTNPVGDRDHAQGPNDAKVTLVEYADYECPQSSQAHHIVKQLQAELGSNLRFVFRNFPLTQIRPHALSAALAAEAAGLQDSFWVMHDLLFEHQSALEPEQLIAFAQVLGMDIEHFVRGMTSENTAAHIREDFISGIRSGVNGTPTFFINGQRHDGAYDYESLHSAIKSAAKRQRSSHGKGKPGRSPGRGHTGARL